MDRVQIAALALGIGLLLVWIYTIPSAPPPPPPRPAAETAEPVAPGPGVPAPPPAAGVPELGPPSASPPPTVTRGETVRLRNDAVRLEVSDIGGQVRSVELLEFADRVGSDAGRVQLVTAQELGTLWVWLGPAAPGFETRPMDRLSSTERSVTHGVQIEQTEVRRTLTLDDAGYGGWLRLRVGNRGSADIETQLTLGLFGRDRPRDAPDRFQSYQLVVSTGDGGLERKPLAGIESPGFWSNLFGGGSDPPAPLPAEWIGVESQYFLLAAIPDAPKASALRRPLPLLGPDTGQVVVSHPALTIPPGRQVELGYRLYFGPKIEERIEEVDPILVPAAQIGWSWVRPLVVFFSELLVWTHANVVGNYGVAIILLTVVLRLLTYPLTQRSMKSMKRLSQISPEMKALQEKHKGDRERLSQEMMALYKRTGINPVTAMGGGCLPMVIQMPFLIALYFALQGSIELRHAPFGLWIQDLSAPENLAVAGFPLRPLPLLMGGSMLLQQWLSPSTGDPQQRQMMLWMSVIFTFMFYQFPSGLVLYWLVSNLLGIGQQMLVNRGATSARADGGGGGSDDGG